MAKLRSLHYKSTQVLGIREEEQRECLAGEKHTELTQCLHLLKYKNNTNSDINLALTGIIKPGHEVFM